MNDVAQIVEKPTLTKEDLQALENYEPNEGTNRLYSFFTPVWLCQVMYDLAVRNGFIPAKGRVLEPAAGTGNFLTVLDYPEHCTAFELDPLNAKIAARRAPKVTIYNQYFETAFLQPPRYTSVIRPKDGKVSWLDPFDLVIGNPPYGKYKNLYSGYFKSLKVKQVELFFMLQGMKLLRPGGLLVFITASSFLRNDKTYQGEKEAIGKVANFVDAYRMPKVFKNTDVPTDILIFRRK